MLNALLTKSRFYEEVEAYVIDPILLNLVRQEIPNWRVERSGIYIHFRPEIRKLDIPNPTQGFKLHISPDIKRLDQQTTVVARYLGNKGTPFKLIADPKILLLTTRKSYPRTQSGKFITIYPATTEEFISISLDLRELMRGYIGPYVLTDRRVPGSSVLFYRYGAFKGITEVDQHGVPRHMIRNPEGQLVEDVRAAGHHLPEWVSDVFDEDPQPSAIDSRTSVARKKSLFELYKIERVIRFSNTGGLYVGKAIGTTDSVFVKEARPHLGLTKNAGQTVDYRMILVHEHAALERLADSGFTPRPLGCFEEWEGHTYVVQEYIHWQTWQSYFASDAIVLRQLGRDFTQSKVFCRTLSSLLVNLIDAVMSIHARGVIHGDLSTGNILISENGDAIRIIDFESAVIDGTTSSWSQVWGTPGFLLAERKTHAPLTTGDDWYAVAKCIMAAILPFPNLPSVTGQKDHDVMCRLAYGANLPSILLEIFEDLLAADISAARQKASTFRLQYASGSRGCNPVVRHSMGDIGVCMQRFDLNDRRDRDLVLARCNEFLDKNFRGPADFKFWPTNKTNAQQSRWSLESGASGILLCLDKPMLAKYTHIFSELDAREINDCMSPGLLGGLAGIGLAASTINVEFGHELLCDRLFEIVSDVKLANLSVGHGLSGIGLYAVQVARKGSISAHQLLSECYARIRDNVSECRDNKSLLNDRLNGWGYFDGGIGVAYFLAHYYALTDEREAKDLATDIVKACIHSAVSDDYGRPIWIQRNGIHTPYMQSGGSGIASVLLRLASMFGREDYEEAATSAFIAAYHKYSARPGLANGVAGILDAATDFYLLTKDDQFKMMQKSLLDALDIFLLEQHDGFVFADPLQLRLSLDALGGSPGVCCAIRRAVSQEPLSRWVMDYDLVISTIKQGGESLTC